MNTIKKYINLKSLPLTIITFILFWNSTVIKLLLIKLFHINYKTPTNNIILTLFSNIILLLVLVLIYKKELIKEFKKFKNNMMINIDIGVKCWLVGLLVMMISNIFLNIFLKLGGASNEKLVQEMIKNLPWLMVITAGIIAPIIEEIVFRKSFKNLINNKYLFIFLSGFIFGLLHVISYLDNPLQLLYIIPYGSLGVAFAISYEKTDTIFTPISMHMLHNTILTLLSIIAL